MTRLTNAASPRTGITWLLAGLALALVGCSRTPKEAPAAPSAAVVAASAPVVNTPPPPTPMPEPGSPREASARGVVAVLRMELLTALNNALAAGGPEEAVMVCRHDAPRIAAHVEVTGSERIRVGRTSHRLRSPANAPEPWMQPALDAYASGTETRPSLTIALPDGSLGYVEPIKLGAGCLPCHGESEQIPAGVRTTLAESYPEDAATGFKEGEFRGLFWALVPPSS